MLQDHSSKWSAAASPGGLIGLVLTILAVMALGATVLSLLGQFELPLSETILIVLLGVSVFAAVLLLYLLFAYVTISYRLEPEHLKIRCGVWSATIRYDEMESVEPVTDVFEADELGWVPYWPGYYVGKRSTDYGTVRVVATLPPRRQIAIIREDGDVFAISPERPQLFIEDLARWHEAFYAGWSEEPETDTQRQPAVQPAAVDQPPGYPGADEPEEFVYAHEDLPVPPDHRPPGTLPADVPSEHGYEPPPERPASGHEQVPRAYQPPAPEPEPEITRETPPVLNSTQEPAPDEPGPAFGVRVPADEPDQAAPAEPPATDHPALPVSEAQQAPESGTGHVVGQEPRPDAPHAPGEPEPAPGPVFGTSQPADQDPQPAGTFGFTPPQVEPSYVPAEQLAEQQPLDESEMPTDQLQVWFPEPPAPDDSTPTEHAYQQFADAGWTTEQAAVEHEPQSQRAAPFAPPRPVIAPHGTPRREVMQPITRVQRAEPVATSPAIRPMIHRDPVSIGFVGVGLFTGLAMVGYLLIQWDDIPPSLTLHWNAEGLPGRVGEAREIWILPLIAGIVLFANIGLAWSIAQFDRFAARLTLSSTVITHIVLWIALLMILG